MTWWPVQRIKNGYTALTQERLTRMQNVKLYSCDFWRWLMGSWNYGIPQIDFGSVTPRISLFDPAFSIAPNLNNILVLCRRQFVAPLRYSWLFRQKLNKKDETWSNVHFLFSQWWYLKKAVDWVDLMLHRNLFLAFKEIYYRLNDFILKFRG